MSDDASEKRILPRRRAILGGRLFDVQGKGWDCTVRDLSEGGAKVTSDATLSQGEMIDLKINKFDDIRRAEVMWAGGRDAGLRFVNKIDKVPESMRRFFGLVK